MLLYIKGLEMKNKKHIDKTEHKNNENRIDNL